MLTLAFTIAVGLLGKGGLGDGRSTHRGNQEPVSGFGRSGGNAQGLTDDRGMYLAARTLRSASETPAPLAARTNLTAELRTITALQGRVGVDAASAGVAALGETAPDAGPATGTATLPADSAEPDGGRTSGSAVPAPEGDVDAVSPTATTVVELPAATTSVSPDDRFAAGYRDQGGPEYLLDHLLRDVLPCEGGPTYRDDFGNGYRTRGQFSADTWAKITSALGALDGTEPYDVGRAVAYWVNAIGAANVATNAGWPVCGR